MRQFAFFLYIVLCNDLISFYFNPNKSLFGLDVSWEVREFLWTPWSPYDKAITANGVFKGIAGPKLSFLTSFVVSKNVHGLILLVILAILAKSVFLLQMLDASLHHHVQHVQRKHTHTLHLSEYEKGIRSRIWVSCFNKTTN